ncbi:hypothetical protein E2C01_056785 [Portunus trituberculatus]|uniref:Uncharacterized protein n=1 Tax=Portunus trituberculatus TaxID=210409 RepID=A0A5B7GYN6_PORTR|nr:hypothetical protein [Portunus trituberculatus]
MARESSLPSEQLSPTPLSFLPWSGRHLEIATAQISPMSGWITVAVCYNQGLSSSLTFNSSHHHE